MDRDHHFTAEQKADYDSLRAAGRSLYDDLRWHKNATHAEAFDAAAATYGFKKVL